MNHVYKSGDRVLLGPFTIPVNIFLCFKLFLYSKFSFDLVLSDISGLFLMSPLQYLLDYAPFTAEYSNGKKSERSTFDAKSAARIFDHYVRKSGNLLEAKLVQTHDHLFFFFYIRDVCFGWVKQMNFFCFFCY